MQRNSADDARFERKTAKDGSPYFVLRAVNGETIGKSEMYRTVSARERGIQSVRVSAPAARVIDRT